MQWLWNIESNQPNPSQSGLRQAASLQTAARQTFATAHGYTFFNIGMEGHSELATNTNKDHVLVSNDQGSTLNGSYGCDTFNGNDIFDNTNGAKGAVLFGRAKRINCETENDEEGRVVA